MSTISPAVASSKPQDINWQDFIKDSPDTALQQAGVTETNYQGSCISLTELSGTALLRVHSLQPSSVLNAALSEHYIALPGDVNQSLGIDPAVICMAPGEWLLFSEYIRSRQLFEQLIASVDTHQTAVLDLSAGLTVFRLAGSGAPWLLNKLCGLDFQRGITTNEAHAAQTRLQQAAVTLHYHLPGGRAGNFIFDLIIERSIARYVWQLLIASIPHAEELEQQFHVGP